MSKRLLLNLVLVLAVVGLVALLWLTPGENETLPPITPLTAETINRIAIDYPDAPSLRLQRKAGQWHITDPVNARAADNEVKPILDIASSRPARSYIAGDISPGDVGLDPPKLTLQINDISIQLGGSDSLDNNRFVKIGDQIHLISVPIENALDADYTELVAREVLPEDAEITGLQLPEFSVTPSDQGGWQVAPTTQDKGADAAQFTIDTWNRARALWIKKSDPELETTGKILVDTTSHGQFQFEVIATQPQLVLRAPTIGVDYHLGANQTAPLLRMEHPETRKDEVLKPKPDVDIQNSSAKDAPE